jgi:hypothetical protein
MEGRPSVIGVPPVDMDVWTGGDASSVLSCGHTEVDPAMNDLVAWRTRRDPRRIRPVDTASGPPIALT